MPNPSFFTEFLADAQTASAQTGVLVSVILAQWADETAYGSTLSGPDVWNFAGLTGNVYGATGVTANGLAIYASESAGLDAYIQCLNQSIYNKVRTASGSTAQATALGQSPWAGGHYVGSPPFNYEGGALVLIIQNNNLTQYDGSVAVGSTSPSATAAAAAALSVTATIAPTNAGQAETQFTQLFQPTPPPAPGLSSYISQDSFTIDGQTLSLVVSGALVTPQLDLSITQASTVTLTIADPDRIIINSPVFSQVSMLQFAEAEDRYSFVLVSVEKEDSVLTVTFEAEVVSALRQQTGAFAVGPGTMTRTQFAQMLINEVSNADVWTAPNSYLRGLKEGYTGQNQEQLSRGTVDLPLEDSWTCLQRLASEIQWVCFESFNKVYFGPWSYLASQAPVLAPVEWQDGINTIDGTYDVGQPLSDLSVSCTADSWSPLIGQTVQINNLGPFNGIWIVSAVERDDMLEPDITITLTQPLPGLPEPSTGGATAAPINTSGGTGQTAGGTTAAQKALAFAEAQLGKPYSETVDGGVGPNDYDCSGLVQQAYASAGVAIDRTTYEQWPSEAGAPVPPGINNLLPGDLVYFGYTSAGVNGPAVHVAMVVSVNVAAGTVTIIEAPHSGAYVQYSTMTPVIGAAYGPTEIYLGALRPSQ